MKNSENTKKTNAIIEEFRINPINFILKNQHESPILEFKSSFELDTALNLCPLSEKNKTIHINQALSMRIFETLVAFANTHGGLLILGLAESKGQIVDKSQKERCGIIFQEKKRSDKPCYKSPENGHHIDIGELKIYGIEKELAVCRMDFDAFQRRFQDRFTITGEKKRITFKPKVYPCDPGFNSNQKPVVRISMSNSVDQYIDEIFSVPVTGKNNKTLTLGAVTVKPAPTPIYLTIEENNSQNMLYALPIRKTGKTKLEKDLGRVQAYISNRFGSALAKQIAEELSSFAASSLAEKHHVVKEDDVHELVGRYAGEWKEAAYPYNMVEEYGKKIKSFTGDLKLWEKENRAEVMALLLMVSLHYNSGWEKWTLKNKSNETAVTELFETFHMNYWRTRFRALYALQFMDWGLVAAELKKPRHGILSNETLQAILTHVAKKTVAKFIRETADAGLGDISKKARQVLTEIATIWVDPDAGFKAPL